MPDTTLVRLTNDRLARLLHQPLYQRMLSFCEQYTPEFPGDSIVQAWMQRLYAGDTSLHILVRLDTAYNIVGHAVIEVQNVYGVTTLHCYQVEGDKRGVVDFSNGMEYVDKLAASVNAKYTTFYLRKVSKALEKYGYTTARVAMIKSYNDEGEE